MVVVVREGRMGGKGKGGGEERGEDLLLRRGGGQEVGKGRGLAPSQT